jgi:hypothetical protein
LKSGFKIDFNIIFIGQMSTPNMTELKTTVNNNLENIKEPYENYTFLFTPINDISVEDLKKYKYEKHSMKNYISGIVERKIDDYVDILIKKGAKMWLLEHNGVNLEHKKEKYY